MAHYVQAFDRITKDVVIAGVHELLNSVNGNTQRVTEIVTTFIQETPMLLQTADEYVRFGKYKDAAELIHRAKIRYGYLGLDFIMEEMSLWENQLDANSNIDHQNRLVHFDQATNRVIAELKKTPFYHAAEPLRMEQIITQPNRYAGKNVLVAEDDEINAMVFELLIQETGATVTIATDGSEALKMAFTKVPDLIFIDVHMPFFSGIEAIRELRGKGVSCPIISLSASTRLNERQNSIDAGANEFIIKPANRESINKMLTKYLN